MKRELILFLTTLIAVCFIFLFKLDYSYFFTDEILYIDSGREHLKGLYQSTMQVPLISKYIAGLMYRYYDHNVYILRLPFAIFGIFTSLIIFRILQKQFGFMWGLSGMMLYASSNIITNSTKMVMLEPLMHLAWVSFLYFYFEAITSNKFRYFLLSGIFLGLALSSKITSIILLPFIVVFIPFVIFHHKKSLGKILVNYTTLFGAGFATLLVSYIDPIIKYGRRYTYDIVYKEIFEVYFSKNDEGKRHIVKNDIYTVSPYWTYGYFILLKESAVSIVLYLFGFINSFFNRNIFVVYYLIFFVISFVFHQIFSVKSERYVSSFLLPLIILTISSLFYLEKRYLFLQKKTIYLVLAAFLLQILNVLTFNRTEYNGLFEEYLRIETNNFTNDKKIYIFGSTRSSRWYKHGKAEGKEMFEISGNLVGNCNKFKEFDFLILEKEQLMLSENNLMYKHTQENIDNYDFTDKFGFLIFKKNSNNEFKDVCQN